MMEELLLIVIYCVLGTGLMLLGNMVPYHARTTTSRHYHSFYYFRGYSRDASRYNNRASGYQNYDGTAPEYNYSDTYRSYSNTVRQGSTGTRTSSGGGIGFGK